MTREGSFVDGMKVSPRDDQGPRPRGAPLDPRHRIGVREDARHPGGINIFGRGFGNYDQDIVLRLVGRRG